MNRELIQECFSQMNKLEGKEYLLSKIAYGTAPVLRGIKPASLMAFSAKGKNMYMLWEKYKQEINRELGLDFFVLREESDIKLVLFYKREMLLRILARKDNKNFLQKMGYAKKMTLHRALETLKTRFKTGFPHEVGIFLGIPLKDVESFIKYNGKNYLYCRYWKVYHNPLRSIILFKRYDKARKDVVLSILNKIKKISLDSGIQVSSGSFGSCYKPIVGAITPGE